MNPFLIILLLKVTWSYINSAGAQEELRSLQQ